MSIKGADLVGNKFGRLVVIDKAEPRVRPNGAKIRYWKCLCECGAIKEVDTMSLTHGTTKSCGCWKREKSRKDLTGQRFGKLIVTRFEGVGKRNDGKKYCNWLCKCDCGNETIIQTSYLTSGETKSCGCLQPEKAKHHYEGTRFGKLTVIREDGRSKNGCVIWLCRCDCGNEYRTTSTYLRRGYSTSCGCETKSKQIESHKTHGMSDSRLFKTWINMKNRCENPNTREYHNYGGRGIKVCDEWKHNFVSFYNWSIESGYIFDAKFGECTLDRIDVDGDYCPENCRWITNKEQQNNKRNNRFLLYRGSKKTMAEWSEITGISASTIKSRIERGWSVEEALETPVNQRRLKVGVSA